MAKVAWQAGIDYVSGALCKCGKKAPHKHGRMLLATHRRAATTSDSCNRIYLRDESNFVKSNSTNSVWARQRFEGIAALVDYRRKDLSRLTQDQINFLAQRNTNMVVIYVGELAVIGFTLLNYLIVGCYVCIYAR